MPGSDACCIYCFRIHGRRCLSLRPCLVQAVPNLPLQIVTVICWCGTRVLLYSSFYAVRCCGWHIFNVLSWMLL